LIIVGEFEAIGRVSTGRFHTFEDGKMEHRPVDFGVGVGVALGFGVGVGGRGVAVALAVAVAVA